MQRFGNILKQLRLTNDMTQTQLASKLGVTKSLISAYENDLRMPSYDVLIRIAKTFDVSTDYLLEVEIDRKKADLSGLSPAEKDAIILLIKTMKRHGK
ncbi:MAG: helix-turn-helix transcriptional regulator [Eubacteriales bacterium]|nr:helix-turn-helix transcriptional regulator [Lachnospiraceae bacterium]MDO5127940.1 helix-turn-helix transcriptional regulator [Eubacteriales bacterium]